MNNTLRERIARIVEAAQNEACALEVGTMVEGSTPRQWASQILALFEQEPMAWRPIESAPRDGTTVRLYSPYLYDEDFNPSGSCEAQWLADAGWQGAVWNSQFDKWDTVLIRHATQWMPLPPKLTDESEVKHD